MELEVALPGTKRRYGPERVTGKGTFELGNRAHSLCLTRNHAERGQLVKSVPSECVMAGVTLHASIQNRLIGPSNVQTISELFCSAPAGFHRAFPLLSLNQIEWSGSSRRLAAGRRAECDFRECGRMIP